MDVLDNIPELISNKDKIEIWDNSKRAKNLITVFWIIVGLTILGLVPGFLELQLLNKLKVGEYVSDQEINISDITQGIFGLVQSVTYIVSIVFFLNWFRRAYGNLHRVKVSPKYQESMALWTWFIPIISLFRPVQIMNEIWTQTQQKIVRLDSSYVVKQGGLKIGLWWTLFIISNFVGNYILKSVFRDETIEDLIQGSQALLVSDVMQIPEALLVIFIVKELSSMESKLAREIQLDGGVMVYKK